MQQKKMTKSKIAILSIGAVLLALVLVLSGVGIYFKLNRKEKPVEVNPLDFSVDAWDGTVSGVSFNEAYAGRSVKTKTINSASAFAHFVNEVNSGNTFEGYTIYLNSNIDLKNKTINPIGTFKGTFDGGHYTILNAKVKGKALFDNVENATIKNIGLYNSNCNLINTAVNSNIENTFVRLGSGNLVNEFISNNGPHFVKNSFVDSSAENLINKLDTNNSQENEVTISNCYYTSGLVAVKEKVGESFVVEDKVVCPTDKNSFAEFNYTAEYSTSTEWCDYDYLAGSKKLDFVYPLQAGFVKVFLTGSCYESVMVAGDTVIDSTNLAHAFTEADKEEIAEVNLLVEKIFMEAKAEVETSNVTINAMKDTTIIRGENNTESMFVSKGDSTISIGINNNAGVSSGTQTNETKKITIDGNRSYIEKNELESNALIVSYGGKVDIGENVVIKNNINNSEVGYGGAVLLYNTSEVANISATFENCHSEKGGGAVAVIGS
ncbi:MAG: hypothetical protein IKY10_03720, partial [Clostridia bacterium]|nr:hypothetical protein [Clostridia bacterium]